MKIRSFYPLFWAFFLIFLGCITQFIHSQPTENNINKSCSVFTREGFYPSLYGRIADNYTDAVMLLISRSEPDKPSFERFFVAPLYTVRNSNVNWADIYPIEALCQNVLLHHRITYPRYWHGYQIVLRPLLYFTDYQHIRTINKYAQQILFILLLFLFYLRRTYGLILGWIVCYIILGPAAMPMNMTYSIIYYIMAVFAVLLLSFPKTIKKYISWPIFFMIIGITTSFFDFLTYPIATLAIPLTILMYMYPPDNFKHMMKELLIIVTYWLCGYALMWGSKWVICTLITDENVINDAIKSIIIRERSQVMEIKYPIGEAIKDTFLHLWIQNDSSVAVITGLLISIMAILRQPRKCFNFMKAQYFQLLPFAAIASGIIVYCLIIKGHPLQHAPYTYRLWIVFFFPLISGLNFWAIAADKKTKEAKYE